MPQDIRPDRSRRRPVGEPPNQAMISAARKASRKELAALLRNGGDLNGEWRHYRPLHALIQPAPHQSGQCDPKRLECLRWMLRQGADPETLGGWPKARAILLAAFGGEQAIVDELRTAGARVDCFLCAALGDSRRIERILREDSEFISARDTSGLTALHCAAASRIEGDQLGVARMLLDHGADPKARSSAWGHTLDACYFAISSGNKDLFTLLLERGADATEALSATLWHTGMDLTEVALEHGASINNARDQGLPVLNQMVRWGRITQAMWLLAKGASPNVACERGWTSLHQAAARGNEGMLLALLEAGGDVRCKSKDGKTPLDVAKAAGRASVVDLLAAS